MSIRLRLFPLKTVLFPGAALNLHVFEPRYRRMIEECLESGDAFGVALIFEGEEAGDPNVTPHDVGSLAEIVEVTQLPFGRYNVTTVGGKRFRIERIVSRRPYLVAEAELLDEEPAADPEGDALVRRARSLFIQYEALVVAISGREADVELPADATGASFAIGDALQMGLTVKQHLLETNAAKERLDLECRYLERALPQLRALLERRREATRERDEREPQRADQSKYFGKFFSSN